MYQIRLVIKDLIVRPKSIDLEIKEQRYLLLKNSSVNYFKDDEKELLLEWLNRYPENFDIGSIQVLDASNIMITAMNGLTRNFSFLENIKTNIKYDLNFGVYGMEDF